ncbi:hypothetical protein OIU84_012704 [Salix udensis]|uniref:C2 domain-containing protein n=1 Tax=Salix udensis TaxID=889485 RepID=A0AAD6JHK4_9ROSI|nr:hypothetical protein OIU84_012704 [Salix udensis]
MIHMCFSLAELRSKKAVSLQDKDLNQNGMKPLFFTISEGTSELVLKIMDRDTLTDDDYLGKASIPLEPLFIEGNLPATAYSVVKDEEYRGEIRVGLSFTPEDRTSRALDAEEEGYGGWKESAYTD